MANYKYTAEAEKVLEAAEEYALRSGSAEIGTEHMLYGLITVESEVSGLFKSFGVSAQEWDAFFRPAPFPAQIQTMWSHRCRSAVAGAWELVIRCGRDAITPADMLYELLRLREGIGLTALKSLGVNLNLLMSRVTKLINPPKAHEDEVYPYNASFNFSDLFQAFAGYNVEDAPQKGKKKYAQAQSGGVPKVLLDLGLDMTARAREGKFDPVIGRSEEIERIIQILCRKTKNNPVLLGEPGVGKSAVVEGLAMAVASGNVPELLRDKIVFSLDIGSLMAGTKYRGEMEEKLKEAIEAIVNAKNIIVFIDELHTLAAAGGDRGEVKPADMLKPYLSRGELQTIGATTLDEYKKYIEKDKALERRFQPIILNPPSVADTIEILKGLRDNYEKFHKVKISDEAITAAATLSDRYIMDRFLPDKAIDLVDEASSRKKVGNKGGGELVIGSEDIAEVIAKWTGIPVSRLNATEKEKLLKLEEIIHRRVIGQDEAVVSVAKAIRRARAGLKNPAKPIGSFIFLGPTGVGKTELCKALAEAMFDDENLMIRLDMSEYMEAHSVSKLIGSPPGYVGYEEGGQLTEQVRRKPYSVILFDEIEKAHPDVFNLLLQMLDDGRLTDSQGRVVNFKNTIIIMTSNAGVAELKNATRSLGFSETAETSREVGKNSEFLMNALKRKFRPEFLNRIDVIVVFKPLEKTEIRMIAENLLKDVAKKLAESDTTIEFTEALIDKLVESGYDPEYGARPLKRMIEQMLVDPLAEKILAGEIEAGGKVKADFDGKTVVFG